jgi:hypothetical protein
MNTGYLARQVLKSGQVDHFFGRDVMTDLESKFGSENPASHADLFSIALREIARRIGAQVGDEVRTPISEFKSNYSPILDRASGGSVEVLTRGKRRYVILDEAIVEALILEANDRKTIGEAFAGLPSMPAGGRRPLDMSIASVDQYRLPGGEPSAR